ncbi:sodium:proton exchanger [Flexivirga sp. ID2601S]|uniref:Sodium:proton exchanger n=1 Tax=Flexivirga aerilata TaxID=1656889 RepID=A0A849AEU8_9MICO|nr:cation:proton antiporter [Flexivirga aerilata]NNG38427.1 sodium:proton exchanger [Flexivirga aerilata]
MTATLLVVASVFVLWSLIDRWLLRSWITAPVFFALAGAVALLVTPAYGLTDDLNTEIAEKAAEYVLSLVLFVDALEVRDGLLGRRSRPATRLLLIGLPLTILAGVVVGVGLFPDLQLAAVLVIVCAVSPTDMAPATDMMRDERVPHRLRGILNLESGYNDGIVAPIFAFGMAWIATGGSEESAGAALGDAIPASVKAVLGGIVIGVLAGYLLRGADARGLTTDRAERIGIVAVPILAYTATVLIHGNGFVAAFVCGIAFRLARGPDATHHRAQLLEDVATTAGNFLWFVLGGVAVVVGFALLEWRSVLFALLMLTVVRVVPVLIALWRTDVTLPERVLAGLLGPRGIATIVFGLLAFNGMSGEEASVALQLTVATVVLSLLLHGPGSLLAALLFDRYRRRRRPGIPEQEPATE